MGNAELRRLALAAFVCSSVLLACDRNKVGPDVDPCPIPRLTCDGTCVDPSADPRNCGGCGMSCPAGQSCDAGACTLHCDGEQAACGAGAAAYCAPLASDPANCGTCGNACPQGQACDAGACTLRCEGGRTTCGAGAGQHCADLAADRANCGACGRACADGETCGDRVCVAPACILGMPGVPALGMHARALMDVDLDGRLDAVGGSPYGGIEVAHGNGDGTFLAPYPLDPGVNDWRNVAVTTADMNGDGWPELLGLGYGAVAIFPGLGSGSFGPAAVTRTVYSPTAFALADFDRDGDLDVAIATYADALELLWNDAGVLARPVVKLILPRRPNALQAADLDGDGWVDLVATGQHGGVVRVLWNDGGEFTPVELPAIPYARSLAVADLDADGVLDLAVGADVDDGYDPFAGGVAILDGLGDRRFAAARGLEVGRMLKDLAVADWDGDGQVDLIAADWWDATVHLLRGQEHGFAAPERIPTMSYPTWLALGDVDGDGLLDLAANDAIVLGRAELRRTLRGQGAFRLAASTDFDLDGLVDMLLSSPHDPQALAVFSGDGNGGFTQREVLPLLSSPWAAAAGDLDGDTRPDLVVGLAGPSEDGVAIYWNRGLGFEPGPSVATCAGAELAIADVDGDGRSDVVVPCGFWGGLDVILNGAGGLVRHQVNVPDGMVSLGIAVADADGDGAKDLFTVGSEEPADSAVLFLPGRGDGTFGTPQALETCRPWALAIVDVDGDRRLDLLVNCAYGTAELGGFGLRRGDGAGGFGPIERIVSGVPAIAVEVVDLDGDGRVDLVFGDGFHHVGVALGLGGGAFADPLLFPINEQQGRLIVAEIDRDGRGDVVTSSGGWADFHLDVLLQRCLSR
jgi:hypothetical protein